MSNTRRKRNATKRLFHEQGGRCYYCNEPMLLTKSYKPLKRATLDHIVPLSQGGAFAPTANCVAACSSCNGKRGTGDARLFMLKMQGAI